MRAWVTILFFLSAAALAESPTAEPSASPSPAASSLSIDRLFGSIRNNVSNFFAGTSPPPTTEPVAEATASPAPAKPSGAVASILSIKPEKPATTPSLSTTGGGSTQSSAPPVKVEFDDNQKKKTQDYTDYGGGGGGGGSGKHQGVPSKVVGARGKPQAFDKWYPVCLFFDGVTGAANAITKGLTDMAAKCGVNLITYPVFVSGAGGGINGVKNLAKQKCNATDGFGRFGVNRGSAILVTGNASLPAQMCGSGDVQHCGEMGWNVGQSLEARLSSTGRWGGVANGMAFGVALGTSLATVAAALGQTELGLPPGYGAGNGVGEDNEGYASAGAAQEPGWSAFGCQRMRETAFDNDGRWKYLADRQFYAVPPKTGRLYDLGGGKPLFNKPKAPPAAGAAGGGGGGGGGGGAGSPAASSASATSSGVSGAASAPPPGGGEATASIAGGHKQKSQSNNSSVSASPSATDSGSGGRRELEDGSTVRNRLVITDGPSSSGATETSNESSGSRPRAEADGSSSTASVYFDDSAKRPSSVGVTNYETGGTQVGGQLLSAGGAAALKSQLESGTAEEGDKPKEEKEDESRSKKRPTETDRKPASTSTWDSVFNGDYFKKIFKTREDGETAGSRRPRVVQ